MKSRFLNHHIFIFIFIFFYVSQHEFRFRLISVCHLNVHGGNVYNAFGKLEIEFGAVIGKGIGGASMSGLEEGRRPSSVGPRDHGWGRGKESQRPRKRNHKC